MDFDLPNDETMEKMRTEYARLLNTNTTEIQCVHDAESVDTQSQVLVRCILFLYIGMLLGYNGVYGTEIYDTHGSVGRVRRTQSAFGSVNNLRTNDG